MVPYTPVTGVNVMLIPGDVNRDNQVDLNNFNGGAAFGAVVGDSNWNEPADLNCDDAVDRNDFNLLVQGFGQIGDP